MSVLRNLVFVSLAVAMLVSDEHPPLVSPPSSYHPCQVFICLDRHPYRAPMRRPFRPGAPLYLIHSGGQGAGSDQTTPASTKVDRYRLMNPSL
jgi:hypothetical protein